MNGTNEVKDECIIIIRFPADSPATPEIYFNKVNAFQIMGAAQSLEVYGKNQFILQENEKSERRRQEQLSVARPEVLVPKR